VRRPLTLLTDHSTVPDGLFTRRISLCWTDDVKGTAMNKLLRDLYSHQAWADALLWKGLEAFPPALKDIAIRNRQHHYHFTQTAFLWVARGTGEPFKRTKPEDYGTDAELKASDAKSTRRSGHSWTL